MTGGERIRVVLIDDHQMVREGLRALLGAARDLDVVGEAADGDEAAALALASRAEVVVMDVSLRGIDGVEATRRLVRALPAVRVVMLSMHEDPPTVGRALQAGALGYVLKGRGIDSLSDAIRAVARGERYLSAELSQVAPGGEPGRGTTRGDVDPLSLREREVLRLIAEGLSGPQVAARLGLRPKTIENHRSNIMDKLGVRTTAGLVRYALRVGISR